MNLQEFQKTGVLRLDAEDIRDPGTILVANKLLDDQIALCEAEALEIAKEYGVSYEYGVCILYLRSRSRWTEDLEDRLVEMARTGDPAPNMNDWPPRK